MFVQNKIITDQQIVMITRGIHEYCFSLLLGHEVNPESKFQFSPKVVLLVGRECACVAVEREYVGIMQCSFSLATAVVIAQC